MPKSKKQAHSLYFLAYVLLAIMIANSAYLSYKYLSFYNGGGMLSNFDCVDDCDAVMMSEYSMLFGIPVPLYGLAYFIALTGYFVMLTNYKSAGEGWVVKLSHFLIKKDKFGLQQKLFELLLILGCCGAGYFLYILYFVIHMICKFCLLSHSSLLLFALIYFFALRRFDFKLK